MGCQCSKATPADQPIAKTPTKEPEVPPKVEQPPPERVPEPREEVHHAGNGNGHTNGHTQDASDVNGLKSVKSTKSNGTTIPRGYTAEAEALLKALDSQGHGYLTLEEVEAKLASGDLLLGPNLQGHSKQELVQAVRSRRSTGTAGTADAEAILEGHEFLTMQQLFELLESGELEVGPRIRASTKGSMSSNARGYTAEAEEILKALDADGKGFVTVEELQDKLDAGEIELGPRVRYDSNQNLVSAVRSYKSTGSIPRGYTADAEALLKASGDGHLTMEQLRALIEDGELQLGPHASTRPSHKVSSVNSMQSIPRGYTADAEALFNAINGEFTVDQLEGLLECGELQLGPRLHKQSTSMSKQESLARSRISTTSIPPHIAAEAEALMQAAGGQLTLEQLQSLLDAGEVEAGPRLRQSLKLDPSARKYSVRFQDGEAVPEDAAAERRAAEEVDLAPEVKAQLKDMDSNNDGKVDSNELKAALLNAEGHSENEDIIKPAKVSKRSKKKKDHEEGARDFVAEAKKIMQALDASGKGKVTVEDFRAAVAAGAINLGPPVSPRSPRGKRALESPASATEEGTTVSDSDAPKKGKKSPRKTSRKKKVRAGREEEKSVVPGQEEAPAPLPHDHDHKAEARTIMQNLDTNHNGRVSAAELRAGISAGEVQVHPDGAHVHAEHSVREVHRQPTSTLVHAEHSSKEVQRQPTSTLVHAEHSSKEVQRQPTSTLVHAEHSIKEVQRQPTSTLVHAEHSSKEVQRLPTSTLVHAEHSSKEVQRQPTSTLVHAEHSSREVQRQPTSTLVHAEHSIKEVQRQPTSTLVHAEHSSQEVQRQPTSTLVHAELSAKEVQRQPTSTLVHAEHSSKEVQRVPTSTFVHAEHSSKEVQRQPTSTLVHAEHSIKEVQRLPTSTLVHAEHSIKEVQRQPTSTLVHAEHSSKEVPRQPTVHAAHSVNEVRHEPSGALVHSEPSVNKVRTHTGVHAHYDPSVEAAPANARSHTADARELLQELDENKDGFVNKDELAKGMREGKVTAGAHEEG